MTISPAQEVLGRVESVRLGMTPGSIVTTEQEKVSVILNHGFKGDSHAGARLADVREKDILSFGLPKGLEISNFREFSAVSQHELAQIAHNMGLPSIPFGCLGENLVLSGIPNLTLLPPGTLMFFRKNVKVLRTAVLLVAGENTPCIVPGQAIRAAYPEASDKLAGTFVKAAIGLRGIVGKVYASGRISQGDEVVVKIPEQRIW